MTEGAAYSGLPKRTSLGTSSASAAEKAILVRDALRVGRLRGVNAAVDAAIAISTFTCLLIFEKMAVRNRFCVGEQFDRPFRAADSSSAKVSCLIVRVQSDLS